MSTIWNILNRKGNSFWFIEPDSSVLAAVKRLGEKKIGALMVMEDERVIGVFSERDLVRLVAQQGAACLTATVREVMTSPVYAVKPTTTVDECMALMTEKGIRHVPVLDGKSSLARLFVSVHATAGYGDAGFDGQYTLEVTVTHPIVVFAGMRIAQIRFHTMHGEVGKLYSGNYTGETSKGAVASRAYKQFEIEVDNKK